MKYAADPGVVGKAYIPPSTCRHPSSTAYAMSVKQNALHFNATSDVELDSSHVL